MPFNTKLKELRLQNNLSQEQLSRRLDITTRPYIDYEKGKKYPPVETLLRMAKFFGVSVSYLVDEQSELSVSEQTQVQKYGTLRASQLVEEISGMFASGELSEMDKNSIMTALQEAYRVSKN